ncbi:MAG: Rieske 2Fe-2S protein [Flavipsychrobacter sp.]|jgi:uncharacterized membrane protein/nitrite reductase/ring-hydroxylating ferredoxin subunit|nr:Rieske 2Fe-2S protein [Flavipsychrobacter sp.]
MRSKASINGHPIHPILVAFPIAFFTGTLLFDVVAILFDLPGFGLMAGYLAIAGIVCALLAAVPGIIDYFFTVPPQSSAKKRAARHGLLNITVVLLFATAVVIRHRVASPMPVIAIELVAIVLLTFAGYMGGTLVYRNQIGVYNRYADKGIWQEGSVQATSGKTEVANANELKTGHMKLVHAGDKRIVIAKTETGYVAFDDRCTHRGGSLMGGVLICNTVQCPWHGSQFDVTTGAVKAGPATEKINTYPINEDGGKLYLVL